MKTYMVRVEFSLDGERQGVTNYTLRYLTPAGARRDFLFHRGLLRLQFPDARIEGYRVVCDTIPTAPQEWEWE